LNNLKLTPLRSCHEGGLSGFFILLSSVQKMLTDKSLDDSNIPDSTTVEHLRYLYCI
jgi:hypothetical protein